MRRLLVAGACVALTVAGMSLSSFARALATAAGVPDVPGQRSGFGRNWTTIEVSPDLRAAVLTLADEHGVRVEPVSRYWTRVVGTRTDPSMKVSSRFPARAAAVSVAEVLVDWESQYRTGELTSAPVEAASLTDLARQVTGHESLTSRHPAAAALAHHATLRLEAGPYGSDPVASDPVVDTFAVLLGDRLPLDTYGDPLIGPAAVAFASIDLLVTARAVDRVPTVARPARSPEPRPTGVDR